jgi:phosphoglycerate dehydrogenase-like enzyme
VALVWSFEKDWLMRAQKLEWIFTPAAGRDYFQVDPGPGLDIDYGTFHGEIMAETVVAMMLDHCRRLVETARLQSERPWPRRDLAPRLRALRGARVTIVGFGHIGQWIGRLAKPFGVRLTGVKRQPVPSPDYFGPGDRIVARNSMDSSLPATDFLILSLPRSDETDHLFDERRLGRLPPRAVVINVGRGNAIDETALARKLERREIAAAYLDVYETEPLPESSPLRRCPNTFLMPHASAIASNYLDLFVAEFIRKYRMRYGRESGL